MQTLLSDWTFNNDSKAYGGFTTGQSVGSFATTAASYGETYTTGTPSFTSTFSPTPSLSSNTGSGAVFSGSDIKVSFNNTNTPNGKPFDINGGYGNDYGFGAGYDGPPSGGGTSAVNPAGGSGGAGSLLMYGGGQNNVDFNLASAGYRNLTLSFQIAALTYNNTGIGGATCGLQYTTDGVNFVTIPSTVSIKNDTTFTTYTTTLPAGLNDLSSFDIRLLPNTHQQGGIEIDNFMLSGDSVGAVPEPGTWIAGAGLIAVAGCALRRRRVAR